MTPTRASIHPESSRPERALLEPSRPRLQLPKSVLAILVVAEFVLVFVEANRFFYYFDDIKWQMIASRQKFGLAFLSQAVSDHFAPAFLVVERFTAPLFGYSYWGIALVIATVTVMLSALLWCLGGVFGTAQSLRLPLVALLAMGPIFAAQSTWWSSAIHTLFSSVFILAVWLLAVRYWKTRSLLAAVLAGLILFVADCFIEKVSIWTVLIPLFDVLVLRSARPWRTRLEDLGRSWPMYGSMVVASSGFFLWWYLSIPLPPRVPFSLTRDLAFSWWSWFAGFWPMVFGLRGTSYDPASLSPVELALLCLAQVLVVVLGVATWRSGRRGRGVVLWFVAGFLLSQVVLAAGRGQDLYDGARVERYEADSLIQLAVAIFVMAPAVVRRWRTSGFHWRSRVTKSSHTVRTASCVALAIALGAGLYVHEVQRDRYGLHVAVLQRRAFQAMRALAPGTQVLDLPTPWSYEAAGYTNPSGWRRVARADQRLTVTDVGPGPFVALNPDARFQPVHAVPEAGTAGVCSSMTQAVPFHVGASIPRSDPSRPDWVMWVDVTTAQPVTLSLEMLVDGTDITGPIRHQWIVPTMVEPQWITTRSGSQQRLWFWVNPRWWGTVQDVRLILSSPGRACVGSFGYGLVP